MTQLSRHTLEFIDSWLKLRSYWSDTPGFSVAIAVQGEVVFDFAYGHASLNAQEVLTPKHKFHIASQSKTFTATAILQLQEQGLLKIDDYVVTHVHWLDDHQDERWKNVTIRQLLSHSAGVIRDGERADFWQLQMPFPNAEELRNIVMRSNLIIEPNVRLKYSNIGYGLIGCVVESVSGLDYESYISRHILSELNMQDTNADYRADDVDAFATGYSREVEKGRRNALPHATASALAPATGFCSTAIDLCKYYSAHLIGTGKLLTDDSKKEMQRLQWTAMHDPSNYGLGFQLESIGARETFGHAGGFPGFSTIGATDKKNGITIVVLTNAHDGAAYDAMKGIFSIIDALGGDEPAVSLCRYEGCFASLGSMVQTVVGKKGLMAIYPNTWTPFKSVTYLKPATQDAFTMGDSNSYYNEGELMRFMFDSAGGLSAVVDGGITMPISDYGEFMSSGYESGVN